MVYRETTIPAPTPKREHTWQAHAIALLIVLLAIALILGSTAAFFGALIWIVWSYVMHPVFGLAELSYGHACIIGVALALVIGNIRAKTGGSLDALGKAMQR
jgi:ABC-type xylose transport system permease subunit